VDELGRLEEVGRVEREKGAARRMERENITRMEKMLPISGK
jgi:hypothetical protein